MKIKFLHSCYQKLLRLVSLFLISLCLTLIPLSSPGVAQTPLKLAQECPAKYQAEDYLNAVDCWQQAVAKFKAEGDMLNQAMAMSNLSLSRQKLGQWEQAGKEINSSLQLLRSLQTNPEQQKVLAQSLDIQGLFYWSTGQNQQALDIWKEATEVYQEIGDRTGIIRSKLNQVQAWQALGFYLRSHEILKEVKENLDDAEPSLVKAKGLRSLGNTFRKIGELEESLSNLSQSLDIANNLKLPSAIKAVKLDLGNTYRAKWQKEISIGKEDEAIQSFKDAIKNYQDAIVNKTKLVTELPLLTLQLKANLNLLSLMVDQELRVKNKGDVNNYEELILPTQPLVDEINSLLTKLPASRTKTFAQIKLANNWQKLGQQSLPIAQLLAEAQEQAHKLGDQRAESSAFGSLGKVYEEKEQLVEAEQLTEKALIFAQNTHSSDLTYRWQWQLGRILTKEAQKKGDQQILETAISTYDAAVKTLETVRSNLLAINSELQFSFRDDVEPLYRELIDLLVQRKGEQDLNQASQLLDELQLAELENFLRCNLHTRERVSLDKLQDNSTVIIYPILLQDRLEVLVKPPKSEGEMTSLKLYPYNQVSKQEVEKTIADLRKDLGNTPFQKKGKRLANKLYDWLIKPGEEKGFWQPDKVKNLVFVLDSSLRQIPMAALYDGQQYLIEKYTVAISIGSEVPHSQTQRQLKPLILGQSQPSEGFDGLEHVIDGIERIKAVFRDVAITNYKTLVDKNLNNQTLTETVNSSHYSLVHLATHGQFSSDPEETFVITAPSDRLNLADMEKLFRQNTQAPIELLVLSACQTAQGDDRAILGLTGITVQAGVSSSIGTLWAVEDAFTSDFMPHFYRYLSGNKLSKAEALAKVQRKYIHQGRMPDKWSPFVIVGNWSTFFHP